MTAQKMVCLNCGSKEYRRIYDATVTRYVGEDGHEREHEGEVLEDVNLMDDDAQEQCEECGSYRLEEAS